MFDSTQTQQQVLRGPVKSAERPTIGPRPLTGHNVIVK